MPIDDLHAKARVQVTVDIVLHDVWSKEAAVEQVFRQAKDKAIGMIRQNGAFSVVGEPKVTAIFLPDR